jgi:hypothetical protein
MTATVTQLFAADLSEDEATRLRRDLEDFRSYLAGPCSEECDPDDHPRHRHFSEWYDEHRAVIVSLNAILEDEYRRGELRAPADGRP